MFTPPPVPPDFLNASRVVRVRLFVLLLLLPSTLYRSPSPPSVLWQRTASHTHYSPASQHASGRAAMWSFCYTRLRQKCLAMFVCSYVLSYGKMRYKFIPLPPPVDWGIYADGNWTGVMGAIYDGAIYDGTYDTVGASWLWTAFRQEYFAYDYPTLDVCSCCLVLLWRKELHSF